MAKSYTSNYIKIYLWQTLSVLLNFTSMFIVTPALTGKPVIYGIYILCISLTIFLSYSDLGFLSAGYKYASESFAKKEYVEETKIAGFVLFILLAFMIIVFAVFLFFSFNPMLLIKDLHDSSQVKIASKLLFTLAYTAPLITIGQRFLSFTYGIRLEDYLYQRIIIAGNLLKIVSVFYFFRAGQYDIVGYYRFAQITTLLCVAIAIFLTKKRYNYDFLLLIKSIRFSQEVFKRSKSLALASLYGTIAWILVYELDSIVISKFLGSISLAYYAIGLTIVSLLRTIFGTVFNPFSARFNHYIGLKDAIGLKQIYLRSIHATLPLSVFFVLSIMLLLKPLVNCWVGSNYQTSILLSVFLIFSYVFSSISYPTSILMIAKERSIIINRLSFVSVVVAWGVTLTLLSKFGIVAFAIGKCLAMLSIDIFYVVLSIKFLECTLTDCLKNFIFRLFPSISFIIIFIFFFSKLLPLEKGTVHLFYVLLTGGIATCGATVLYYFISKEFKDLINHTVLNKFKIGLPLLKIKTVG